MTDIENKTNDVDDENSSGSLAHRPLAARRHFEDCYVSSDGEELRIPHCPSFNEIFNELGKVFRKGDESQIKEDLTFLLKWGLKYGSKFSSFKASQAENAFMKTLIGPYELRESSQDTLYLTIPKLMIEFAGSTMKLAKDMLDTVSGVGEDKRLETPAYAWMIRLVKTFDDQLAKRHEEAHLYARYMFSEAINKRNDSWQSKSISQKVYNVKRFYELATNQGRGMKYFLIWDGFRVSDEEKELLAEATGGDNLISSRTIDEAAAKWQELLISAKAS